MGIPAQQKTRLINFLAAGTYSVSLIGSNNLGCADTLKKEILLGETKTDFEIEDTICVNAPIIFKNTSAPKPVKALWEFSDGTTDSLIDAPKIFTSAGTYIVKLTNNYSGCVGTKEKTITVQESPNALFTASVLGKCSPDLT